MTLSWPHATQQGAPPPPLLMQSPQSSSLSTDDPHLCLASSPWDPPHDICLPIPITDPFLLFPLESPAFHSRVKPQLEGMALPCELQEPLSSVPILEP